VGQRIRVAEQPVEIVGVSEALRLTELTTPPAEAIFLSRPISTALQAPLTVLFRTADVAGAPHVEVRNAIRAVLPDVPIPEPTLLTDRIDEQVTQQRVLSRVLTLVAILAMVVAAIGLYGVVSLAVAQRRHEFGIRLAIGANGPRIARLVFGAAARIVGLGTVLGLLGAYALGHMVRSLLFGVSGTDVMAYLAATTFLTLVAAVACALPAWAAMRTSPTAILRGS
jgi:ABC-type antimicrobial peptide transport system permease subunit